MTLPRVAFAGALLLTLPVVTTAQTPAAPATLPNPISRFDAGATIGWLNGSTDGLDTYNDFYNRSVYTGFTAGWYWTDNVKTEADVGLGSRSLFRGFTTVPIDGRALAMDSEFRIGIRRIAIGQVYQFYRNVTFHPFVAGGVDVTWKSIDQRDGQIYTYDPGSGTPRVVRPAVDHPRRTEVVTRPFTTIGYKAYITPHGFFRNDLRFVYRSGIDEVTLGFGFGVDFP